MLQILKNRKGQTHINTAITVVIGVVIGALLLGGLYFVFAGEDGIIGKVDQEVSAMMDYGKGQAEVRRVQDDSTGVYVLEYSFDGGKNWSRASMPKYGAQDSVYGLMSGTDANGTAIQAALVRNGDEYHVITSANGSNWTEQVSFTAVEITHFYYGTSASLPRGAGSFEGERFVCRYRSGGSTYFTMVSNGVTWVRPTWSDIHFPT